MSSYSIIDYGKMLEDEARTGAYVEALRRHVTPDSVVLDLGTGIGFFAVIAARLGARRVYGIDRSELVEIGRQIAARNGVADRVTLIRGDSLELDLPEPVDLMVCDVRGILPWALGSVPPVIDARRRHLAENATIIPLRDRLFVALADNGDDYREKTAIWRRRPFDVDLEPGRELVVNLRHRVRLEAEQLLSEARQVATLEYASVESPNMVGRSVLEVERAGRAHGLAVWFDGELTEGLEYSNRPGEAELIYGQLFFPWSDEVAVEEGERLEVVLEADYVNGEYVWRWRTSFTDRAGSDLLAFEQSNFFAVFPSRESRVARSATHEPGLSPKGRAALSALREMEAGGSVETIARRLVEGFPELFDTEGEAQGFAGDLSIRYGRPIG